MAIEVRPARPDEAEDFRRVMGVTFGMDPNPETMDRFTQIWEPDRSLCAYDDGKMVATLGTFSLNVAVPGGELPMGGTTQVAVLPTHRRQGLLRRLMSGHLQDVAGRGELVAALWASESSIYGRFGFGVASARYDLAIPTAHREFHHLAPTPAAVTLIGAEEAKVVLPPIYERIRSSIPGMFQRSERWWAAQWFYDAPASRGGATSLRFALSQNGDGYVIYRQKADWVDGNAAGRVIVRDLLAQSPESWAGLWNFVLAHDLVTKVEAGLRPIDDPIIDLLAAPRWAKLLPEDALWIRLLDPAAALASRRYSTEGSVVIEARDLQQNTTHTLLLEGGPDGATCATTDRPPELVLDIEDLGGAFLGRARFRALARAGRLSGDSQALARADAMFRWDPQPWCAEIF